MLIILQWDISNDWLCVWNYGTYTGNVTANAVANISVTYACTFTSFVRCFADTNTNSRCIVYNVESITKSSATVQTKNITTTTAQNTTGVSFLGIGY